ncbi:MAG: hypothetical protein ACU0GG_09375 [Paracoccaceae bacterium]
MSEGRMMDQQTEHEVELRRSEMEVDYRLRDLTANLIRLARGGGGKFYEVEQQMKDALVAFGKYREVAGEGVSSHKIDKALNLRPELERRDFEDQADVKRQEGTACMIRGALQFAASHLLGQNTQGANGVEEMFKGQRIIEECRR